MTAVLTILEAQVKPEKAALLEETYRQALGRLDAGIKQTFLLQSPREPGLWQIVTEWQSREALDAMRRTGETPRGVLIFRTAGAEPSLRVFEVAAHAVAPD